MSFAPVPLNDTNYFLKYKPTSNLLKSTYFIDFVDISGNLIMRNGTFNVTKGDILVNNNDFYLDGRIYVNGTLYTDYLNGNPEKYYFKHNTFFGKNALNNIVKKPMISTLGDYNSVIGHSSGYNISRGFYNSAIGYLSGNNIINNQNNTCVGYCSDVSSNTTLYNSSTAIGYNSIITGNNLIVFGTSMETTCVMGNLFNNGNIIIGGSLSLQQNNFTIINLDANLNVDIKTNGTSWTDTLNGFTYQDVVSDTNHDYSGTITSELFNQLQYVQFNSYSPPLNPITSPSQYISKNITLFFVLFIPPQIVNQSGSFNVMKSNLYGTAGSFGINADYNNNIFTFTFIFYNRNAGLTSLSSVPITTAPTVNNPFILTVNISTSGYRFRFFHTGSIYTNLRNIGLTPNSIQSLFYIFNNSPPISTPKFGIGQFIQINRSMTLKETQKMEGYLASKWGLQSILSSDHPYNSQNMATTYDPYVYDANYNGFNDIFRNFSPNFYSNLNGSYIMYDSQFTGNLFITNNNVNSIQLDANRNIGLNNITPSFGLDISGSVNFNRIYPPALQGGNIYSGTYGDEKNNLGVGLGSLYNTLGNDNVFLTAGLITDSVVNHQNTFMGFNNPIFYKYYANSNRNTSFGFNNMYSFPIFDDTTNFTNNCVFGKNCLNNVLGSGIQSIKENCALGYFAIFSNASTNNYSNNCAMGYQSLYNHNSVSNNCAFGYNTLSYSNLSNNCGFGNNTKYTSGVSYGEYGELTNFIGNETSNKVGDNNCVIGNYSLNQSTNPSFCGNNCIIGNYAMHNNATGSNNSTIGNYSMHNNTTGSNNSVIGAYALYSNKTGNNISGIGNYCLYKTTTGPNDAMGNFALHNNNDGSNNVAVGYQSLYNNTNGSYNTAIGYQALHNNTSGINNIAIGYRAGYNNTYQGNNIFIGNNADLDSINNNWGNSIALGNNAKIKASNQTVIGTATANVYIQGNLTVVGGVFMGGIEQTSDYRIKDNVVYLNEAHNVSNLNPVVYDNILTQSKEFGFIAHEVKEQYPELVEGEKDGSEYQTLNYMNLITLALNETKHLKQKIQKLKKEIEEKEKKINNFLHLCT